ncbi:MAG TPA: hypothetical protein VI389_08325 [Geobacteraceae bacterium]
MTRLELTEEETCTLAGILDSALADLRLEIAATDSPELREELRGRENCLRGVLDRLVTACD